METFEAIATRRSVRRFTGEAVSDDMLKEIVNSGRMAASGNNKQPWHFIVVRDKDVIQQLKGHHEWIGASGAIIAVVGDPSSQWWLEDCSAAVQNMLLAVVDLGLGSCWMEGFTKRNEAAFKELLSVPEDMRLFTLLPVGVPAESPEKEKKSLEEVLHWERF